MNPDPSLLLEKTGITRPPVGLYDAPDKEPFQPFTTPDHCIFSSFSDWMEGKSIFITEENFTCGGVGYSYCGVQEKSREDFISFLAEEEGLKASDELMGRWLEHYTPYRRKNNYIIIGPLREEQYQYLETVTFFVNPDQLSALMTGAQYYSAPEDAPPVLAPFGSGCSLMLSIFDNLEIPQATISSTDIAMRQHLPPDILSLTVTRPMYERLCRLDERSFLYRPFWKGVMEAREKK